MKIYGLVVAALLCAASNALATEVDCAEKLRVGSYFSTHTEESTGKIFTCQIDINILDSGGNFSGVMRCRGNQEGVSGTLHGSNFYMLRRYGGQLLRQEWVGQCTDQSIEGRYNNIESPGHESGPIVVHY